MVFKKKNPAPFAPNMFGSPVSKKEGQPPPSSAPMRACHIPVSRSQEKDRAAVINRLVAASEKLLVAAGKDKEAVGDDEGAVCPRVRTAGSVGLGGGRGGRCIGRHCYVGRVPEGGELRGGGAGMHWKGGRYPPSHPPGRPACAQPVALTASASFKCICNQQ